MTTQDKLVILSDNLRLLRERDNLSTTEMAKIMRISVDTYKLLEQGTLNKSIKVDSILYVSDYFKLDPADLFKAQKEKPNTP